MIICPIQFKRHVIHARPLAIQKSLLELIHRLELVIGRSIKTMNPLIPLVV